MSDTIAAVHAKDVHKARQLLRDAVTRAGEAWLPSDAIIDAMTLELIEMAGRCGNPAHAVAHLTQAASLINHTQKHPH